MAKIKLVQIPGEDFVFEAHAEDVAVNSQVELLDIDEEMALSFVKITEDYKVMQAALASLYADAQYNATRVAEVVESEPEAPPELVEQPSDPEVIDTENQ